MLVWDGYATCEGLIVRLCSIVWSGLNIQKKDFLIRVL